MKMTSRNDPTPATRRTVARRLQAHGFVRRLDGTWIHRRDDGGTVVIANANGPRWPGLNDLVRVVFIPADGPGSVAGPRYLRVVLAQLDMLNNPARLL